MTELITQTENSLSTIKDLATTSKIGREHLSAIRAEIRALEKAGAAAEFRAERLKEAQDEAELVLDAEVKLGQIFARLPKSVGGRPQKTVDSGVHSFQTKAEAIQEAGFSVKQAQRFESLADYPDIIAEVKAEARENDDIVTRSDALNKIKAKEKKEIILKAEKSISEQASDELKPTLTVGNGIGFAPTEKYDLLLTDPPYSTDIDDINKFVSDWLYNALNNVKETGFAYVFIGAYPEEVTAYLNAKIPKHMQLTQLLVWTYKNTLGNNPNDRYKLNYQFALFYRGIKAPDLNVELTNEQWAVQEINAPDGRQGDRYHAWQKPMEIAERFIRHSTEQGMTVFDPFACTGTFLLAATKLGRKAYGFEINPENAQIAFSRGCVKGA